MYLSIIWSTHGGSSGILEWRAVMAWSGFGAKVEVATITGSGPKSIHETNGI